MFKRGLTFDDVLLVPQYSDIGSRSEVDIGTNIGPLHLNVPIIAANMDTVTELAMAKKMGELGGLGVLHRYASIDKVILWMSELPYDARWPSIGIKDEDFEAACRYFVATDRICIDVAHGDSKAVLEMVKKMVAIGYKDIIAGNVATGEGALRLADAGANIIKVGVGGGSNCTTRIVTGHGVPQLSAIFETKDALADNGFGRVSIIADGGIRSSGDIVKAIAAGADAVMVGSLLAGTDETPIPGTYRGMASEAAQVAFRGKVSNDAPEGVERVVEPSGPVKNVIDQLAGGIRSGFSYSGARNVKEFRSKAQFVEVTTNGLIESHPHGLKK